MTHQIKRSVTSILDSIVFPQRHYESMENPLHSLGYKLLNTSLQADSEEHTALSTLSRRGFLLAAASLSSCAAAEPLLPRPGPYADPAAEALKNPATAPYRPPPVREAAPRNPNTVPQAAVSRNSGISFTRVMVSGNYIAMTFDDGPHPKNTPRLLNMLRERNIKATFYVIGQNVDLYPQIVRNTVAEGHEIGNHTHTHRLLSKLSDAEVRKELSRCREAIARAAGVQPRTMRPPYGGLLQRQREWVYAEYQYPTILWSVDPLDWKRPGASVVSSRILAGASSGGIVLAHDLHAQTIDAMPATLDGLLRRGYQFVTVSQLLAMKPAASPASVAPVDPATI
jgi:peptidoglycan-N-acetylglucosamine deacetylase